VGEKVCLRVADLTIALITAEPTLRLHVAGATRLFCVEEGVPDVSVLAAWGKLSEASRGARLFTSGHLWQLYEGEAGSYHFYFASSALGAAPYKVASFDRDFTSGEILLNRSYCAADAPLYPLEYPLDELLLIHLLAKGRGIEVHACGAVDADGDGHLFAGQSGAGKTTMARLWEKHVGGQILSDDRIVLRKVGTQIFMYGTPWHGEGALASPAKVPLKQVYFLRHGRTNDLRPVATAAAVGRLLSCAFPLFYDRAALEFSLAFLAEVAHLVPCGELEFLPDATVVAFMQDHSKVW